MKNLLLVFLVSGLVQGYAQQQDPIKNYPGIPIITYGYEIEKHPSEQYTQMKQAGIFAIEAANLSESNYNNLISGKGLLVLPEQTSSNVLNYIVKYTEGRYTKWEAEGQDSADGRATLYHDSITCEVYNGAVRTTDTTEHGTLIYGPMYSQEKNYTLVDKGIIDYKVKFTIKAEDIIPNSSMANDTVCILQVTATRTYVNGHWDLDIPFIIKDSLIRYGDLFPTGNWKNIELIYNLIDVPDSISYDKNIDFGKTMLRTDISSKSGTYDDYIRKIVKNIEFKVIWKGKANKVRLYVDSITVYDIRGLEILTNSEKQALIITQVTQNTSFKDSVAGWLGMDESSWSIDTYAPTKKIGELISDATNGRIGLWLAFNSGWSGCYGDPDDLARTMKLPIIDEFMRRVKKANVWLDCYYYDWPLGPNTTGYEATNLNYVGNIYKTFINAQNNYGNNLYYGMSIQTGRYFDSTSYGGVNRYSREVEDYDLLYSTNLALMYGAKIISPWLYFGFTNGTQEYTGFRNPPGYSVTDKYLMLKNILKPRLDGLLGKTLKKLTPTAQYLNHTLSSSEGFIQSIIKGGCTVQGMQPSDEAYDLGFFKDDFDLDYFMLINRWYNPGCNPALTINIKPEYFPDNYNLKIVNLINNTTLNTITKYGYIYAAPEIGDACFFSVAPVVKYGGLLAYNDTIKTNTTLSDNMTIDAGKVLQINEGKTYTITDTITFTDTSSFITGYGYVNRTQNGWITTRSWNKSLFKGRSGSHPKLIWSKHPDITNVINYNIYRNHENGGWQYLTTKSSSTFEYIDSTITIIEGMTQANETSTQYRITVTHRPTRDLVETSPSNTILYHRVEGQGLEKQYSGLTINDFTYNLDQNYPNPFNPTTTINYSIAEDGLVEIEILNILGERIKTLVNEFKSKGNHNISFNASSLASGVYIYKIQSGDFISSKKMIFLK